MSERRIARHVVVHGNVQGVGFRDFVRHHATQRNLDGWVRNRADGTVEAVFAGLQGTVEAMIRTTKIETLGSKVTALQEREAADAELRTGGAGEGFMVLPTL